MEDALWEVVGGADRGGIVVRASEALTSEMLERLACGARVRQLELAPSGRLHFQRLSGAGPDEGWVNVSLADGKVLMAPLGGQGAAVPAAPAASAKGRKLRVVALHGLGHNSNVMKFQVVPLKRELGQGAEWFFLEGPYTWEPGSHGVELSDLEKRLATGKPLRKWHGAVEDGRWTDIRGGCDYLRARLADLGPVDVLVGFSMGSCIASSLVGMLLRDGAAVPWRVSVFFCGGHIVPSADSDVAGFDGRSPQPTIKVTGSGGDLYFAGGEPSLEPWYSDLLVLDHPDGHALPQTQPRAGEIFARVAREIEQRCGGGALGAATAA